MQIMDVYGQRVLVHPQVNGIFYFIFLMSGCMGTANPSTIQPRSLPSPPSNRNSFPHPPSFSYKYSHAVVDRSLFTLLLVCCGDRQGQDAAHMSLDFCTHGTGSVSVSRELPRAGFALLFSLWSSGRMTVPSSR